MAGGWCRAVLFLSFLLIFILNSSFAHLSDNDKNYLRYEGDLTSSEDFILKPLTRIRREEPTENEKVKDGDKSDVTEKKATVPAKISKGSKVPPSDTKSKLLLAKKMSTTTSPSVENPSSVSNTTTSTTTTTSTSSPTTTIITTSIPITTNAASKTDENMKNITGGIMPTSEVVPVSSNSTKNESSKDETVKTDSPVKSIDASEPEEKDADDPDSGDDIVATIDGFNTDNATVDHHRYYKSQTFRGGDEVQRYWVNLDELSEERVVTNELLSDSHRRAATVTLSFDFPFYGHLLRNITIATGGFLFTGDFVHTWLAATQYIAPLMANFDTSVSKDACVKYADNGTSFTVQWDKVLLKDHQDAGTFTFQVTLHKTGDIMFTYKDIPVVVTAIGDDQHPVKVGLSDAYIVDRTIFYVRRKTIYEYHKIDMKKNNLIGNWTAILFKALPTCVSLMTCESCLSEKISFQCQWCNKIGRCSNGLDRNRQDWLFNGCEAQSTQNFGECASLTPPPTKPSYNPGLSGTDNTIDTFGHNASVEPYKKGSGSSSAVNSSSNRESNRFYPSIAAAVSTTTVTPHVPLTNLPSAPVNASNYASSTNKENKTTRHIFPINSSDADLPFPSTKTSTAHDSPGLDASEYKKGIVTDGEPDTLAHTSGRDTEAGTSVGGVVAVVFLLALVLGVGGWITYAYFYPHSTSGQILIRYRPSTWSWRRGEARYTAASIHSIHM